MKKRIVSKIEQVYIDPDEDKDEIDSEMNFSNFFETMDDIFIVADRQGKIIYSNKSLIDKVEYSLQELKTMNLLDLTSLEKREEVSFAFEKIKKAERKYCNLEIVSKSGKKYLIESRFWFGSWDGKDSIYSISKDITMDSENLELSTKIFQNNPLPMSITSIEEGRFLAINSAFIKTLGYEEKEVLGRTVDELNLFVKSHKEKIIKKEIKNQEALIRSKDGKVLNGIFTTETINIQGEEAILGVMVDITEKVKLIEDTKDKYEKLTNIIQGTNLGTWEWNMDTGKMKINEQWANILGYKLEELEPTTIETWYDFTHPEDLKLAKLNLKENFEEDKGYYHSVMRMKHKNGSWIWVDDRGKITKRDHRGKPLKMFGTHIDITGWQNQKLELERFFSINLDLLCIVDIEGHFIKLNKAWEEVLGYPEEELKGRKIFDFIHKEDIEDTIAAMGQLEEGKKVTSFTNRYRCVNDEYRYIEWRSNRYEDVIYGAARDVTERIEYENKLLESSNRDALTGIYNRRYIYERLEEIIEEDKRVGKLFSVCILDIDYFKKINDTYGHQTGDFVLQEFTKLIKANLRSYDLLGRYGGEEFIVIINNADKKTSCSIIKRILSKVRERTFIHDEHKEIQFTFSAGIVSSNELAKKEIEIDKLVNIADRRMYNSKENGRNQITCKD